MAELSVEAIAILCYTAIALFLSLYFVPFKIVPRAWAKAVRTTGHPAKLALDEVLDLAVAKIKMPAIPPFPSMPDTKAMETKLAQMTVWMDTAGPLINNLTAENLDTLLRTAMSDARKAGTARGDGGGGAPPALESAMADAEWAITNPDQAQALAVAHQTIDSLTPVFNWNEAKVKQLHAQANAAKGNVEGLQRLMGMLARMQNLQATSGAPARGGRGGGFNPG